MIKHQTKNKVNGKFKFKSFFTIVERQWAIIGMDR